MSVESFDHARLARELLEARRLAKPLSPPTERDGTFGLSEGYAVGLRLHRTLVSEGHRLVGRKLGLTNQAIWPELGLSEPIWAPIYERTIEWAKDGSVQLSLDGTLAPRIELEVVVQLRSLPPKYADEIEIARHLEWMALGFEIVDCHYPGWVFRSADAVADFGLHRALVIGQPSSPVPLDSLTVTASRNGEDVARGEGKDVVGNPLRAIGYLQNLLAEQPDAEPLSAGEIITTGTLTPALPVSPGEVWTAEAEGADLAAPVLMLQ